MRLIEHPQLIALQCHPKVSFQAQAVGRVNAHALRVEAIAILAPCFDVIHGNVGVLDQLIHGFAGFRVGGNANAHTYENFVFAQLERRAQGLDQLL